MSTGFQLSLRVLMKDGAIDGELPSLQVTRTYCRLVIRPRTEVVAVKEKRGGLLLCVSGLLWWVLFVLVHAYSIVLIDITLFTCNYMPPMDPSSRPYCSLWRSTIPR